MAGQSRATLRREKQKQKQPQTAASTSTTSQQRKQQQRSTDAKPNAARQQQQQQSAYDSGSDSDEELFGDAAFAGVTSLKSLEDAGVRDFVSELQQHAAAGAASSKKTSKRTRAELAQLEIDTKKKRYRETKAAKIVWRKFDRANASFETYYQTLLQLPPTEWTQFIASLQTPMPVHVRVNGNYKSLAEIVTGTLETDFDLSNVSVKLATGDDHDVAFAPVAWANNKSIWKLTIDSKSFRKSEPLKDLASYFQAQCHVGTLLRQEPSTSIVPLFLDVRPGDRVLDLCGGGEHRAPMIAEALGGGNADAALSIDTALLVVNERDATAASSAHRSLARSLALARNVVLTAHKPIEFPLPLAGDDAVEVALFDRVVCAAPCSGDGLIRTIPERWRTWSPALGLKSHAHQVALAQRAAALTRVGGLLVYSTRSFNPIENEAVVAELLRSGGGAFELIDVSGVAPALERSRGCPTWSVLDADMATVGSWDDASDDQKRSLRPTMWPPTANEHATMHLERCVRILPHQNDTHGLFVAVVCKRRHVAAAPLAGPAAPPATAATGAKARKSAKKNATTTAGATHAAGSYRAIDRKHLQAIRTAFGVGNDLTDAHFVERTGAQAKHKTVHVVTPAVSTLLLATQFHGRLAVYRAGVEALRRATASATATASSVAYELTDDGARALLPFVSRRRVLSLQMSEFAALLATKEMWLKHASDAVRIALEAMAEGSLVVVLDDMEPAQTADQDICLVATKRHSSYSVAATSAAIARVKMLLSELNTGDGDDDGYDSFEYED